MKAVITASTGSAEGALNRPSKIRQLSVRNTIRHASSTYSAPFIGAAKPLDDRPAKRDNDAISYGRVGGCQGSPRGKENSIGMTTDRPAYLGSLQSNSIRSGNGGFSTLLRRLTAVPMAFLAAASFFRDCWYSLVYCATSASL